MKRAHQSPNANLVLGAGGEHQDVGSVRKMETKETQTNRNRKLHTQSIKKGQKNQGTCIKVESKRKLEEVPSASDMINSTKKQNATIIQQK